MPFREFLRADAGTGGGDLLPKLLDALRRHLSMEAGFISAFEDGRRVFRYVSHADGSGIVLRVGDSDPLEDSYCARVVDGRLPELIHDAGALQAAREIAATSALPIGAHMSVPIWFPDGELYGTLCCVSRAPDTTLTPRDTATMRMLAEIVGEHIGKEAAETRRRMEARARIEDVIGKRQLRPVFQPIVEIATGQPIGFECLSRFPEFAPGQALSPDGWFALATEVGLESELELAAIAGALPAFARMPAPLYLSLNLGPRVQADQLLDVLAGQPRSRIVLEITEHELIEEYSQLQSMLGPLRAAGVRLAVDDAGAGYASFRHILGLSPDYIKLDVSLTRGIDHDPARRALAAALVRFGRETGSEIIAEGVETAEELSTLRQLEVPNAQGYYLGRPLPMAQAIRGLSMANHEPK